jgi:pimeloyl-ACP methyl ester carboxylesterase
LSREDPKGFLGDARSLVYSIAGDGWVAIVPDNPGLGTEGITGWGYSPDEGRTLLDATRAARKLMNAGELNEKNVLAGHSIGGHAVLSAQSYLESYGAEGTIEATVAFAPIWFSSAVWGAFISNVGVAFATPKLLTLSLKHFYGHLAIEEGEEHALDAFLDDKKQAIAELLENNCWNEVVGNTAGTGPISIGIMKAVDAFTPEYIAEVGGCAFSGACDTPLAATWRQRWVNNRPPPVTSVPIVVWQGGKDDFVQPGYQKCGTDRLEAQGATVEACIAAEADHSSPMAHSAEWVHVYLRHKLLGGAAPEKCPGFETVGADLKCSIPIPNSTDAKDP